MARPTSCLLQKIPGWLAIGVVYGAYEFLLEVGIVSVLCVISDVRLDGTHYG